MLLGQLRLRIAVKHGPCSNAPLARPAAAQAVTAALWATRSTPALVGRTRRMFSRITFRLYLAILAQLLGTVLVGTLLAWSVLRKPPPRIDEEQFAKRTRAITVVLDQGGGRAELQASLALAARALGVEITLYSRDQQLLGHSGDRMMPPLSPASMAVLQKQGRYLLLGKPSQWARLLHSRVHEGAYAVFVPAPPPLLPPPLLFAILFTVLASVGTAVLLARSFTTPLRALSRTARRLGGGDLAARVGIQRNDEFGEMAATFDDMAQRIAMLIRSQQELLANVSHELRTPLSRIKVALELASEGDAELAQQLLPDITVDLEELERLMNDVFDMARLDLDSGKARSATSTLLRKQAIATSALLATSARRFVERHGDRLAFTPMEPLPQLEGDPMMLRRAVDNLLDNAAAYSEREVWLVVQSTATEVQIVVTDFGIGISAADLQQVGTPFFRSDRSRDRRTGGIGLGLSLSRRIVQAHGGTLTLESQLGEGTTARITLPRPAQAPTA